MVFSHIDNFVDDCQEGRGAQCTGLYRQLPGGQRSAVHRALSTAARRAEERSEQGFGSKVMNCEEEGS